MSTPISNYRLRWGCELNKGRIQLKLTDNTEVELDINSPEEFSAVCAFLERDGLSYDPAGQTLTSGTQSV